MHKNIVLQKYQAVPQKLQESYGQQNIRKQGRQKKLQNYARFACPYFCICESPRATILQKIKMVIGYPTATKMFHACMCLPSWSVLVNGIGTIYGTIVEG
jgi:hypothetical protein